MRARVRVRLRLRLRVRGGGRDRVRVSLRTCRLAIGSASVPPVTSSITRYTSSRSASSITSCSCTTFGWFSLRAGACAASAGAESAGAESAGADIDVDNGDRTPFRGALCTMCSLCVDSYYALGRRGGARRFMMQISRCISSCPVPPAPLAPLAPWRTRPLRGA